VVRAFLVPFERCFGSIDSYVEVISSPAKIWEAQRTPRAPPLYRNSRLASSSKRRPSTKVVKSAHNSSILRDVIYRARFSA
jgi:hypothetical protein